MNDSSAIQLRRARATDLGQVVKWLQASGLPTDDLCAEHLAFAAQQGDELLGVIGVESYAEVALLRSLVVARQARRRGVGNALIASLESHCAANGVDELWLLTIDQQAYFTSHAYIERSRAAAPQAIRNTREFSGLCPDDATLMSKRLA